MKQKAKELYEKTQADCKAIAEREIAITKARVEQADKWLLSE